MKNKLSLFCLVIGLCLSCQSADDEAKFKTDKAATQTINQANVFLQNKQKLPQEHFDKIKKLYEQYPNSKTVLDTYRASLIVKEDWATLVDIYQRTSADKLTIEDKLDIIKASIKLGRYNDAVDELNTLAATNNNFEIKLLLANAYFHLGKYDESKTLFDDNWQQIISGEKIEEITMRGMIYFYQGDSDKAIELLNKSTKLNPDFFPAYNGLSRVYAAKGDRVKAEEYLVNVQKIFDRVTDIEAKGAKAAGKRHKLQEAYQAKRYQEVIDLANEIFADATEKEKVILYQYQYESYLALGKQIEAQEVLIKARQLQQ